MRLKKLSLLLALFYASGAYTESLLITADRMFGAESGMASGPVRVVVNDGLIESVNPARICQNTSSPTTVGPPQNNRRATRER